MNKLLVLVLVLMSFGLQAQISIIGPASPSGNWTTDHNLTETPAGSGVWTGTFTLSVGELKFRLDGDWTFNWGGTAWPSGAAIQGGANINVASAGVYNIEFNLTAETYSFTPPPPANVGIGTTSPTEKLDVAGNIKTTGEIKPNGTAGQANQVLTSNGDGTMQWAAMSSGGEGGAGAGPWSNWCTDNISEHQPVSDENGANNDYFGFSVSISGDYAIVGAYRDDEGGLADNGSATIFKRNSSGVWQQQGPKLINPVAASSDDFGWSVSISGDYAIVGAPLDDEGSGLTDNGSATIFKRNTSTNVWESQGKLINPGAANYDYFGNSVSISGDYAIVGAPFDDEDGFFNTGSATIFKRNSSGVWESQGKLTNPSAADYDYFGVSVSISGDYAIVGAYRDDEGGLADNGSATIFKRNTNVWVSQGKLINLNAASHDYFGNSVSISGDYAIVGANVDNEGSGLTDNGSATIFKRNTSANVWESQGKLINPNAENGDEFGRSVSISGDYAIVGANYDDEGNGLTDDGSATVYRRYGNIWRVVQKFTHPGSANNEQFGIRVSIDGSTRRFLVGAWGVQSGTGMAFFGKVK